jgi:hypothetical protein
MAWNPQDFWFFFLGGGSATPPVIPDGPVSVTKSAIQFEAAAGDETDPTYEEDITIDGGWVDVTDDVLVIDPIVATYGIQSKDFGGAVSEPGTLTFALNNSHTNTQGQAGWYSPLNISKRGTLNYNIRARWAITYQGVTYYKFFGRISGLTVTPGISGPRVVRCVVKDIMDTFMRALTPPLALALESPDDYLILSLIYSLSETPHLITVETGIERYSLAFDNAYEEQTTVRELLIDIANSGLTRMAVVGDSQGGGRLRCWTRRHDSLYPSVAFHLDDIDLDSDALVMPGSRDDVVKHVKVIAHPTREDAPLSLSTLYSLETATVAVGPGQTITSIYGPFRDPLNKATRVAGIEMFPPAPVADYTMNTASDGTGADLTGYFSVTANYTATGVRFVIYNGGPSVGYITKLQCQGRGVYRSDVVVEQDTASFFGERSLTLDMTYNNNVNVAESVCQYAASVCSRLHKRVTSVTFQMNKTHERMMAGLSLEPGDRISLTEPLAGLDEDQFIIRSVRLEQRENRTLWCTWGLMQADTTRYWLAGIPGSSEAGLTTIAGF